MSLLSLIITVSQQIPTLWLMRWTIVLILIITTRISHPQAAHVDRHLHPPTRLHLSSAKFVCGCVIKAPPPASNHMGHRWPNGPHREAGHNRTYRSIGIHRELRKADCDRPGSTRIVERWFKIDCVGILCETVWRNPKQNSKKFWRKFRSYATSR